MKKAFTLAEMLIVIAIIGVVAALVMPSLMANYQNRVLMTQLKKSYAEISQAGVLAVAQEDCGDFHNAKTVKQGKFVNKYFKKSKSCGSDVVECFGDKLPSELQYDLDAHSPDYIECVKAKAGYAICINSRGAGVLDTNGSKGPNEIGKDMFSIGFSKDGTINDKYSLSLRTIVENDWDIDSYH